VINIKKLVVETEDEILAGVRKALEYSFFGGRTREDLPDGEGLGARAGRHHHPQRHPSGRAVSLRLVLPGVGAGRLGGVDPRGGDLRRA